MPSSLWLMCYPSLTPDLRTTSPHPITSTNSTDLLQRTIIEHLGGANIPQTGIFL